MNRLSAAMHAAAALLLIFAAGLNAQNIEGSAGAWTATITKEYAIGAGGNLIMRCESGNINAVSWEKNSMRVVETITMKVITHQEAEAILKNLTAGYRQEGETLTITGENSDRQVRHNYDVKLPRTFNLDIRTSGGDLEIHQINGRVVVGTSGGDIALDTISGSTDAKTSGGDMDLNNISGHLYAYTSGGDVSANIIYAEGSIGTSGGDIELKKTTQRLSIQTMGGDIDLLEIAGPLSASTSGGDISLANFSGSEGKISTMGGDLDVSQTSGRLEIETSGGDISCKNIGKSLRARTMGGDVDVRDLRAEAEFSSTGGDVTVVMTLQDFKVPHGLRLESMGGDIILTLPARLPATIEAEIHLERTRDHGKRNDIYSDFPLSKAMPDETNSRILRSKGEINGGGDKIILKTTAGDIAIKKAE